MNDTDSCGRPPDAEPALRAIAMPADANPFGDIFGGRPELSVSFITNP